MIKGLLATSLLPVMYDIDKVFPFLLLACLTNVSINLCTCTALSVVWS